MSTLPQALAAVVALRDEMGDSPLIQEWRGTLQNVARWIHEAMAEREARECSELLQGLDA